MWDGRQRVSRVWLSALGKILGAVTLSAAMVTSIEVLGAGPAGAVPTISFVLVGNLSTGVPTPALTGIGLRRCGHHAHSWFAHHSS
jgi:hypothetical protein